MRKLIQLFVFAALVSAFALPALAQTPTASPSNTPAAAGGQDDAEAKVALYKTFTENRTGKPEAAYQAAKEYLAKYEAKDGPDDQYIKYIKKWVAAYEKIARREELLNALKANQIDKAYGLSQSVLADYPDDLTLYYNLAGAGFKASTTGNEANNPNAITFTKKTIQLIQAGKSFDKDKPLQDKEKNEMLGNLNFALGLLQMNSAPVDAVSSFVLAAQYEGPAKKDPTTYFSLAQLYEKNEYASLSNQYTTNCKTDEQLKSQQCTDLTNKVNMVVDHIIDALARAISYSTGNASFDKYRPDWTTSLTNYYKYRNNNSDTGIKELIAGITARPLPKPGEPVTPPLFTPSTAPAGSTGSATGTTGATTTTPAAGTTTTAPKSTTGTTTTAPKTTTTPTNGKSAAASTKTTPKRAH